MNNTDTTELAERIALAVTSPAFHIKLACTLLARRTEDVGLSDSYGYGKNSVIDAVLSTIDSSIDFLESERTIDV